MEFLNRDFNVATNISRCAVLKTRSEELKRSHFAGHPLSLEACAHKLKSKA